MVCKPYTTQIAAGQPPSKFSLFHPNFFCASAYPILVSTANKSARITKLSLEVELTVVIVQHRPQVLILVNSLAARCINPPMRWQYCCPTTLFTILTTLVCVRPHCALALANHNLVLLSFGRPVLIQCTAFSCAIEQII